MNSSLGLGISSSLSGPGATCTTIMRRHQPKGEREFFNSSVNKFRRALGLRHFSAGRRPPRGHRFRLDSRWPNRRHPTAPAARVSQHGTQINSAADNQIEVVGGRMALPIDLLEAECMLPARLTSLKYNGPPSRRPGACTPTCTRVPFGRSAPTPRLAGQPPGRRGSNAQRRAGDQHPLSGSRERHGQSVARMAGCDTAFGIMPK